MAPGAPENVMQSAASAAALSCDNKSDGGSSTSSGGGRSSSSNHSGSCTAAAIPSAVVVASSSTTASKPIDNSNNDGILHSSYNTTAGTTTTSRSDGHNSTKRGNNNNSVALAQQQQQQIQHGHHSDESSDDGSGNILDRDYKGMFEGPEKTLEVVFRQIRNQPEKKQRWEQYLVDKSTIGQVPSSAATASASASTATTTTTTTSNGGGAGGTLQQQQQQTRRGLRLWPREALESICGRARCTILSSVSNQYLDAYVLSESSLFIYPYMLVLKTCGTTTLLRCIAVMIDLARNVGLEIDWLGYSRKNFNFPGDQSFPHQSFHQELEYLYSHRNLSQRLSGGAGYTLGPVTGDHWFVFVDDQTVRAKASDITDTDRVLNIMMFDIDPRVAKIFTYDEYVGGVGSNAAEDESKEEEVRRVSGEQTERAGIRSLCPGAVVDARAFEPCGYSMNAVLFKSYSTIHITPESRSSYASFETNQKVASYKSLISNVIRTFRPARFVMTLMADQGGLHQVKENPLVDSPHKAKIVVPLIRQQQQQQQHGTAASSKLRPTPENNNKQHQSSGAVSGASTTSTTTATTTTTTTMVYKRSSLASIKVEEDVCCMMGNWVLDNNNNKDKHQQQHDNSNNTQQEPVQQVMANGSCTSTTCTPQQHYNPRGEKSRSISVS